MNEIIALSAANIGGEQIPTVNARDLHAFLGVKTEFKDWIARRIKDFGFVENTDFCSFLSESSGGRPSKEFSVSLGRECQDFCVWGGYSRGSPTRLPFVFEMQYARPDAIAGAKVEGPARSAGGSSLAPAIARREAAGALAREV